MPDNWSCINMSVQNQESDRSCIYMYVKGVEFLRFFYYRLELCWQRYFSIILSNLWIRIILSWFCTDMLIYDRSLSWFCTDMLIHDRSLSWFCTDMLINDRSLSWFCTDMLIHDRSLSWFCTEASLNLTPPLFINMSVQNQESDRSCINMSVHNQESDRPCINMSVQSSKMTRSCKGVFPQIALGDQRCW
jgi:hypothetical protein